MNYRHIYHAGNFADIVKHFTLIAIIEQLKKKEKPFAVLDAFAGIGQYDLLSVEALKTNESINGVQKLLQYANLKKIRPELIQKFLNIISLNPKSIYPGSPRIIHQLLRTHDRLIACELHPEDYKSLKILFTCTNNRPLSKLSEERGFGGDTERRSAAHSRFVSDSSTGPVYKSSAEVEFRKRSNISIHQLDAYLAIKAFLPFIENRGLVFIDPPFERKDEFSKLIEALKIIKHRASNICVLIWYPIKSTAEIKKFYQDYKIIGFKEALTIDFMLLDSPNNMHQCGLLVINPPNIKNEISALMKYLTDNIFLNQAKFKISVI
ncbi:Ribosomal RNA large subunit methyltransferase J [Candidatus Trichorickettsia mobilis]|uniref:Ribosomal RNA large subunit methyltransferase J n=1 Tax=Candidatus Trichorickettsia mobilis TaxID=1346319 RepID=A0ABZ0US89_9RICK|nr:23S rRNA (adenine(2030)-N(6))-methyltransferase RlmJ [Candidatus Trichorickettsia mobilis]WPY00889.1 Ribosomal RNA large subunit methyltransferase J [Candidatus Trichorickettsia mobilis]